MLALSACTRVGTTGIAGAALHPWTLPDTVRIGLFEEPDAIDPVVSEMAFSSDVGELVFDGLTRYDPRGNLVPDLAREIPSLQNGGISSDGKTITWHLMPNAKWQDGVPVTADDVIFTWQAIMNPRNNTPTRVGYDRVTAIDAPDAHTVRIHLNGPYPPALYLFKGLNQGAIVPKHLLAKYSDLNRVPFNGAPLGSGPYIFKAWRRGSEMLFDANPSYFRGKPHIEHVVLKFIPDQNTMLAQLQSHEIDVYYGVGNQQVAQVRALPDIAVRTTSTLHWEHLNFNTRRPPLDDARVRRALCMAVDLNVLHQKIYHGLGTIGPVHFNPDFGWGDKSIVPYPYDPRAAGALLESAGWRASSDGYRYRNGQRLEFALSTVAGVKQREAIEVLLQSWWRAIGVMAIVKNYPAGTLFAPYGAGGLLNTGKTDVAIFTWQDSIPDPDDETFIGPNKLPPAGQNDSFFVDPQIGVLERAALSTYDPAQRRAYYFKIQHVLIEQVPEYVLDWLPEVTASNVDIRGVGPAAVGSDLWNIADWTIAPSP